jgi:hypothetical protein
MTTIIVTSADRGQTVATNGLLTYVRFLSAAVPPNAPHVGYFRLVDDFWAGQPAKVLLNADLPTNCFAPLGPGGVAGWQFNNVLLDTTETSIRFNNLTVAAIADGVSFRLDYDEIQRVRIDTMHEPYLRYGAARRV